MVNYREFTEDDYPAYKVFCERNFGKFCYQAKPEHIKWLRSNPTHFFNIAVEGDEILGCFHGFHAPVKIDNKTEYFYTLHDLMVDRDHRSGVGLRLMQDSIFQDRPIILTGAVGRISRAYKKLGAQQLTSHWYRKFIFPKYMLNFYLMSFKNIQFFQKRSKFSLVNNKEESSRTIIEELLDSYNYGNSASIYFEWRFFHKSSPLTFFMSDKENIILFSLGLRKFVPFIRIFSVRRKNNEIFIKMMKSIQKFASSIGVFVILYSVPEDLPPPIELNYQGYKKIPDVHWFSKKEFELFNLSLNGFSTDSGFEGYTFKKY